MASRVDGWLTQLDDTPAFYLNSITQQQSDSWSRGRVTLVGDAGYCPRPTVGGSTSLAVVGVYALAGELARADGDHAEAFAAYERQMRKPVSRGRAFARAAAKTLVPGSPAAVWAVTRAAQLRAAQLVSLLPSPISSGVAKLNTEGVRMHDSMPLPDYTDILAT